MIPRTLASKLQQLAGQFPVVTVTGPRQSGKTTLVRATFPDLPYVSLETPDTRLFAVEDPRGFLAHYGQGAIFDEVQRAPELFSYLQTWVDEHPQSRFILTGSLHFLLMERISQSLAGRTAVLHLLPFSLEELRAAGWAFPDYETAIFQGQYPPIYDRGIAPRDFYLAYIQTYVERDIRLLRQITDFDAFLRFVQLCAGRVGQILNITSLAADAGISPNTAKAWLSVLEASFILYRVRPWFKNITKRLVKAPKLYFYDTGLLAALVGIREPREIAFHYLKGPLFENLIINECLKFHFHRGERQWPHFWRDHRGREIDCLVPMEPPLLVEIKAGKTLNWSYFEHLRYWRRTLNLPVEQGMVVYGGEQTLNTREGLLLSWRDLGPLYRRLAPAPRQGDGTMKPEEPHTA